MTLPKPNLLEVLDSLENLYGPQKAAGPTDPYEMIVYVNSGYPAADLPCSRGFEALKREVGLKPENILEAPKTKLTKLMRLGGIVPELRAEKLKDIARMVKADLGGDLKAALNKWLLEEKKQPGKGIHGAKNVLQKFPLIGEPGADKILLFSKLAAVAAVPSRQRAYLLIKKHGQEICKRSTPKCEICPLTGSCAYFQARAADSNAE